MTSDSQLQVGNLSWGTISKETPPKIPGVFYPAFSAWTLSKEQQRTPQTPPTNPRQKTMSAIKETEKSRNRARTRASNA